MHLASDSNLASGVLGGVLIGASSSLLAAALGHVSGMSGIVHGFLVNPFGGDSSWRAPYIFGLIASGALLASGQPSAFGAPGDLARQISLGGAVTAGLLVGFGTRLGGGCTSGHGVCGLPRFSPRSLAAVLTFMATGAGAAAAARNVPALSSLLYSSSTPVTAAVAAAVKTGAVGSGALAYALPALGMATAAAVLFGAASGVLERAWALVSGGKAGGGKPTPPTVASSAQMQKTTLAQSVGATLVAGACGALFGAALAISGMTNPERVARFLDFSSSSRGWDPTLMGVMGGAVAFNVLAFRYLLSVPGRQPWIRRADGKAVTDALPYGPAAACNTRIDAKLLVGSALFGIGWGIAGICPGPAVVSFGAGLSSPSVSPLAYAFVPAMLVGMALLEGCSRLLDAGAESVTRPSAAVDSAEGDVKAVSGPAAASVASGCSQASVSSASLGESDGDDGGVAAHRSRGGGGAGKKAAARQRQATNALS